MPASDPFIHSYRVCFNKPASSSVTIHLSLHSFVSAVDFEIFETIPLFVALMDITKGAVLAPTPATPYALIALFHSQNLSLIPMPFIIQSILYTHLMGRFPPNNLASISPSLIWGTLSNALKNPGTPHRPSSMFSGTSSRNYNQFVR